MSDLAARPRAGDPKAFDPDTLSVGAVVGVRFRKWDGTPHWRGDVSYLGRDEYGHWLAAPAGTAWARSAGQFVSSRHQVLLVPDPLPGTVLTTGCAPTYYTRDAPAHECEIYIDIATAPEWVDGVPVQVRSVDLDLDVIKALDGTVVAVDQDEFEQHRVEMGYPSELVAQAEADCADVLQAVRDGIEPFGEVWRGWLAKVGSEGYTRLDRAPAALSTRPIASTDKGFGPLADRGVLSASTLAATRPDLFGGDFAFPLMVLRESALAHNIASMAAYCQRVGVQIAPHGKTMMAPQLAARQLVAGAWGITVATIGQLQTYYEFGVRRLLLANELVDPAGIGWLASALDADPGLDVYCYVDSLVGVAILDALLQQSGCRRTLLVLVELGFDGGRTGVRRTDRAVEVARAVAQTTTMRVAGVAAYEGGLGESADAATLSAVRDYGARVRCTADLLLEEGLVDDSPIVSAGGSAYFDAVVDALTARGNGGAAPTVVIRSGAYLTHDHGFYGANSPSTRHTAGALELQPAIEIWAPVLSRPEPSLALICAGRRDLPVDMGMPVPLAVRRRDGSNADAAGIEMVAVNDQHGHLRLSQGADLAPGDLVCLGISHPCTAFDKWRVIPLVGDDHHVIDAIHTFF